MKTTALLPILSMLLSMSLTAQIIHVPGDHNTIQAGIDAANPGDTVLVLDGTYLENISFMGKAILVTSHFLVDGDTNHIHNTIIDGGDPEDPLHGSVVEFTSEEDTTSIIYGFTITGGTGMYLESQQARIGGGIVCYNATAKISHNRITDNEVSDISNAWGGGIAVHREAGEQWVVIENNIIRENRAIVDDGIAAGGGSLILGDARIYSNLVENNYCTSESNESAGGGFYCQSLNELPDTLKFPHNTVQNNSVDGKEAASGGGIFFRGLFATISENVIRYNTLKGNVTRGGGIYFEEGMISDITANLFASNTLNTTNDAWYGGGIYCAELFGKTTFRNNEFSNNSGPVASVGAGGGICIWDAGTVNIILDANRFLNDIAYHGGGVFERSSYRIQMTNNLFSENYAFRGGAVGMYHPAAAGNSSQQRTDYFPLIINNTFYSNTASDNAGAVRFQGDLNPPAIFNSIFRENLASVGKDINNTSSLAVIVSYSDINENNISGLYTGEYNINVDPEFEAGDPICHLAGSSPCQDAGTASLLINDSWYYCPEADYEGDPRPAPYGGPDMGADEYFYVGNGELQVTGRGLQVFPNPSFGISKIKYQIAKSKNTVIKLFDAHGYEVCTLVDEEQSAGEHIVLFDASRLPAGVYFIRLKSGDQIMSVKLLKM